MKLVPLKEFVCDTCGQIIEEPIHGWVEFEGVNGIYHNFKIIHHQNRSPRSKSQRFCYYHPHNALPLNHHLDVFLGNQGLFRLWDMYRHHTDPSSEDDLREFMMRVQIPMYEEARTYFRKVTWDRCTREKIDEKRLRFDDIFFIMYRYGSQDEQDYERFTERDYGF